ncbi:hypothetical protein K432DRAFT_326163 [Lepidopterella palustris CBS 459.81]|uniref:Uncharacterized protein n=1 Tax=Lepidopterella palustris CBS 459.81 TaxID=1314670 RepID=A0A8E2ECL6_9PEZI|nr:hypothetical protein K432DRAFT_326163 [Lepidopterella palustris CBS 459.81]
MPLSPPLACPGRIYRCLLQSPLNLFLRTAFRLKPTYSIGSIQRTWPYFASTCGSRTLHSTAQFYVYDPFAIDDRPNSGSPFPSTTDDPLPGNHLFEYNNPFVSGDQPNTGDTFPGTSTNDPDHQMTVSSRCWLKSNKTLRFQRLPGGRDRVPPGKLLLETLSGIQPLVYATSSKMSQKVDLSYIPPSRLDRESVLIYKKERNLLPNPTEISLQTIIIGFLKAHGARAENLNERLSSTFSEREMAFLHARGYTAQDVHKWVTALLTENPRVMAEVILLQEKPPPLFVPLNLLRRKHLTVEALRIILEDSWKRILSQTSTGLEVLAENGLSPLEGSYQRFRGPNNRNVDGHSLQLLVVRLLRHARQSWPHAIPDIANLFTTEIREMTIERVNRNYYTTERQISNLSFFCNRLLAILSLPTRMHPITSSSFQETAQFDVLRMMTSYSPPLTLNQEGYRGIVSVQLALRKTPRERAWALLKTKSWPPWKENRTAMDEDKGDDFGISRASLIIRQMGEAGYQSDLWERVAQIYSGLDTDGSPTIQTRINMTDTRMRSLRKRRSSRFQLLFQDKLWAARIRATRTRREAWACFLTFESLELRVCHNVYHAMFEKLHYQEFHEPQSPSQSPDRDRAHISSNANVLPGDVLEVFPDPISPHERVYLREQLPTYENLVDRMFKNDLRPSGRFLAFLVHTCPNTSIGMRILRTAGDVYGGGVKRFLDLLHGSLVDPLELRDVPDYLFTAFLSFLCRCTSVRQGRRAEKSLFFRPFVKERYHLAIEDEHPINLAYSFLIQSKRPYRPAWTVLMKSIMSPSGGHSFWQVSGAQRTKHVLIYQAICDLVSRMQEIHLELEEEQFQLLCIGLQRATISCISSAELNAEARRLIARSPAYIRTLFHSLVGRSSASEELGQRSSAARLFTTPGPAVLHSYVRALGLLRDYEGLYSFAQWMAEFHLELTQRASSQSGGPAALRRTLIALRVYLERNWDSSPDERSSAPKELVALVRERVESVPEWEGWPKIDELEVYCMESGAESILPKAWS